MSKTTVGTPQQTAPGIPTQTPGQAPGVTVPRAYKARRRSPWLATVSVALIAGCGLGFALMLNSAGDRQRVVTIAQEVQAGEKITSDDLQTAQVAVDGGLKTIPADEQDSVVGRRAAVGLKPGSLLARSQVTRTALVRQGEQVVPVGLKPALVHASGLAPGQRVEVVKVQKEGEADPTTGKKEDAPVQESVPARVIKVGEAEEGSGTRVVDVAVLREDGPKVLSWSASEKAALALDVPDGAR
ncbi:SAF domain-containing protein [Streptomyces smyrnaeus]|uniref:SAF domain-containing protein n=1 Tax=Streptomyces smyrnaeus TaxID=1387713 RepID=UPI000C45FEE3